MATKSIILYITLLFYATMSSSQSFIVDMDTASGIQGSLQTKDTAQTLIVTLRAATVSNLFSYQCKVSFDTSKFSFIGAEQDFGVLGEKNILTKNGGNIIGIYQLQTNPPALDTVEFSGTIQGTDATPSVSGDGIIGVLYLKTKLSVNDSSSISISQGFYAEFEGTMEEITSYTAGTYKIIPSVSITTSNDEKKLGYNVPSISILSVTTAYQVIEVTFQSSTARFSVSTNTLSTDNKIHLTLYTLDGKFITNFQTYIYDSNNCQVTIPPSAVHKPTISGTYICTLAGNDIRLAKTMTRF